MSSVEPVHDDQSSWNAIDDPATAGFSVDGIPAGWARADHLHVDGLPATVWFSNPPQQAGFTPNAVFAAWTAPVTSDDFNDLLSALSTPESTDGLILMERPVVLTNTADVYAQCADAVIQSPFGPLSSRVWHAVRRERTDHITMGRLTVTVTRPDAHLLDDFDLRPSS